MAHKQYGSTLAAADVLHFTNGFLLELGVADGKDFVDDENFRVEVGCNGEAEADHHAGGVAFDGGVNVSLASTEVDDFIELAVNLVAFHSEDASVHIDVFAACEFGVEACSDFEERCNAAFGVYFASGRGGDAAEEFE